MNRTGNIHGTSGLWIPERLFTPLGRRVPTAVLSTVLAASLAMPTPGPAFAEQIGGGSTIGGSGIQAIPGETSSNGSPYEPSRPADPSDAGQGGASPSTQGAQAADAGSDQAQPAPQAAAQVGFAAGTVLVPYGVNVDGWLGRDDVKLFTLDGGEPQNAETLKNLFKDGAAPLTFVPGDPATYPSPNSEFGVRLAWSQLADSAAGTNLPDPSGLAVRMAPVDMNASSPDDGDALPLIPTDAAKAVKVTDAAGGSASHLVNNYADGQTKLWLNKAAQDAAAANNGVTGVAVQSSDPQGNPLQFSSAFDVNAEGIFSAEGSGASIAVDQPGVVFVKLATDVDETDPDSDRTRTFVGGQIVRLPIALDATDPTVTDPTALGSDGRAILLSHATVNDGALVVSSKGIKATVRLADPNPDQAAEGETASGIDVSSVKLRIGQGDAAREVAPDTVSGGVATFTIGQDALGGVGKHALSDMTVTASDFAGNSASTSLADAAPFKDGGVTSLEVRAFPTALAFAPTTSVAPYGVNIDEWLARSDVKPLAASDGSVESVADVSYLFQSGSKPLSFTGAAYPAGGSTFGDDLAWGALSQEASGVTLPDASGANVKMAEADTSEIDPSDEGDPNDGDLLPLAPASFLSTVSFTDAKGDARWRVVADGSKVWLNKADKEAGSGVTVASTDPEKPVELSRTMGLKKDGSFATPAADGSMEVTSAGTVFAKLGADTTNPLLMKGQVVRIPFAMDATDPKASPLKVLGSDGEELDLSASAVLNGKLSFDKTGFKLQATLSDAAGAGEEASGVDTSSVKLVIGSGADAKEVKPNSIEGGVATFTIDSALIGGEGPYQLSDMRVTLADRAGNSGSTALTEAQPFKASGVTSVEFIDADSAKNQPEASLLISDAAKAENGTYYTNAGAGATVGFQVKDRFFKDLLDNAEWMASDPINYALNAGSAVAVDPNSFQETVVGSNSYDSSVKTTLPGEGSYDVSFNYTGKTLYSPLFRLPLHTFKDSDEAKVVVDRTNPKVNGIVLQGGFDESKEIAKPDGASEGSYILIGGKRTITMNIADIPGNTDGVAKSEASGIASGKVSVTHAAGPETGAATTTDSFDISVDAIAKGSVDIPLSTDGSYKLSDIKISLVDKAGNTFSSNAQEYVDGLPSTEAAKWPFDTIVVDTNEKYSSGITVTPASTHKDRAGHTVLGSDANAVLWIQGDVWAQTYAKTDEFEQGIKLTVDPTATFGAIGNKLTYNAEAGRFEMPVTLPKDGDNPHNGLYHLTFKYRTVDENGAGDNDMSFIVDTNDPDLTDATVLGEQDPKNDIAEVNGERVLVGGSRDLRVRVQDLLPSSKGSELRDETNTSGIATEQTDENGVPVGDSVATLQLTRSTSLDPTAQKETDAPMTAIVGEDGWVTFTLSQSGLYSLDEILITVTDNAGRSATKSIGEYVKTLKPSEQAAWKFDSILVDTEPGAARSVSAKVRDAAGTPESKDPSGFYHRGSVDVDVAIKDPWFAAYQAIPSRQEGFFTATGVDVFGNAIAKREIPDFSPEGFTYDSATGTWKGTYQLRSQFEEDNDDRPIEGTYDLAFDYEGIRGGDELTRTTSKFGIDYTGPTFGLVSLSKTSPVSWNWVFPHDDETLSIATDDNLSGVNGATSSVVRQNKSTPTPSFDSATNTMSVTFTQDADRMTFDQTSASVEDVAGNKGEIPSLYSYEDKNFPDQSIGFSVDDFAPQISVTYDNNDVRNGRYFNRHRTATITIEEANFDMIKTYDEKRVIATATVDGSKQELTAQAFANPSGDNKTWVATYTFDRDGDWVFDVKLTDPAGRAATPFHDEFTMDTTAPTLNVRFDNTQAANGMYYKAVRTATVTVRERNFSSDLTPITTTADDGNPPSPAGWTNGDQYEHVNSVFFGNETHYTMRVEVTDLAGNTTDAFTEPEFVIDLTPPKVEISGVENKTAYADSVAPSIHYEDINFDANMATYTLHGARQGDAYTSNVGENDKATSKDLTFGDFEHSLKWDDVFTLTAKVHDLAGNEAQDEVTFSVNRFGSNYVLLDGTGDIIGEYLNRAKDVKVQEINVSGLDTSQSHAEIVRDSRVETPERGKDYTAEAGDASGWSETTYTFPKKLFELDGFYRVLLTSKDVAGNLSQNTMDGKNEQRNGAADINFAIDSTAPTADVAGIQSGKVYLQPDKTVGIDAHDNLTLDNASLSVDDDEVASWSGDEVGGDFNFTDYRFDADGQPHDITLTTVDRAGNKTVAKYDNVVIAGDWIAYIRNTPQLLYSTVAGGIGLIAAIAIAAVLYARHRRLTERKRNPFGR